MNIVNITLGVDTQPCSSITLGRRGENEVTQVVVDFSSWAEEFGTGVITLLAMRSRDSSAYPVVLTLDGNTATWDVTSTDTAFKGGGRAEYIYTVGNQIAKSVVFSTVVLQDIGEPSETPPDPYEDWLERLTELGAETQANAEAAQQSAEDAEQSAQEAAESAASVEGAVEQAEAARDAARAAQTASESARDAAQTAQTSAEASATAASGSATSAAGSATAAAGSATAAAGSATAAAGSASDASASASAASASATTASTAATQAEAAKTAAQTAQQEAEQAAQQAHVEYEQLSGEVDDLSDEVTQQKSAIEALDSLVDRKAGALIDTASGSIASFVPDSTIPDLLGVSVAVEPVQDLHGQTSPWPAGGGKNLYPNSDISGTAVGVTVTHNIADESYLVSGLSSAYRGFIASESFTLKAGTYKISRTASSSSVSESNLRMEIRSVDGSTNYGGSNGSDFTLASDTEVKARIVVGQGGVDFGTGITYRFQIETGSTATEWSPYSNICPISGWDSVDIMHSGADTSNPTTYTIQLGQTVYGGTLDAVNGVLTVDRAMFTWTSTSGGYVSTTKAFCLSKSDVIKIDSTNQTTLIGAICDKLKSETWAVIATNPNEYLAGCVYGNGLAFRIPGFTTASEYTAWLADNPLTFVYLLNTPVVIQLDPVTIATIANQTNNVWSDAGDVRVEFAADLKAYIDSKIAAAVAALS